MIKLIRLQSQPANDPVNQSEQLIKGNNVRTVDDESLDDNMLCDPQEEDISYTSASQQPSNLESLNLAWQNDASLSTDSPIHISGTSIAIPNLSSSDSPHADLMSLAEISVVPEEFTLSLGMMQASSSQVDINRASPLIEDVRTPTIVDDDGEGF